jgi:hypothetical protein
MRRLALAALLAAALGAPSTARADLLAFSIDLSLGLPWQTSPTVERMPTNIMLTPGLVVADWVSAELGIVAAFAEYSQPSRWALRPMVGLYPPILPLYAKLVIDVNNLNQAGGLGTITTVGGALGLIFSVGPARLFLEVDYIPQKVPQPAGGSQNLQIWEGRAGAGVKL